MDTAREIFDAARANGMPVNLANFIVAQSRHETADFTSSVFRNCNNAFGYKYIGQANATGCLAAPDGGQFARYANLAASVTELTGWIRRRQNEKIFPANLDSINTADKYAQLLKLAGYYGDPVAIYANGLRRFAVNYGVPIAAGGLALVLIAWLFYRINKK